MRALTIFLLLGVGFSLLIPKTIYVQEDGGANIEALVNATDCSPYNVSLSIDGNIYEMERENCTFSIFVPLSIGIHPATFSLYENGSLIENISTNISIYPNATWELISPTSKNFSLGDRVLWQMKVEPKPDALKVFFGNQSADVWRSGDIWKWWWDVALPDGNYSFSVIAFWDGVNITKAINFSVSNEQALNIIYPRMYEKAGDILFEVEFVEGGNVYVEIYMNESLVRNVTLPYTFQVYKSLVSLEKGLYTLHFFATYDGVTVEKRMLLAVETEMPKPNITVEIIYPKNEEVYYPGALEGRIRVFLNGTFFENVSLRAFLDGKEVNCSLEQDFVCDLGTVEEGIHVFQVFVEYNGSYFEKNATFAVSSKRITLVCRTEIMNFTIKKGQPIDIMFDVYDEKMRFLDPDKVEAKLVDSEGRVFITSLDKTENGMYRMRFYPPAEGDYAFTVKAMKSGYITGYYEGTIHVKFEKEEWEKYFETSFLIKVLLVVGIVLLIVAILKIVL